ncbi:hypothetical protein HanRHA438_Chr05g0241101 [Helianthus annuus]|nr:hypothetical protein HanRHA438_Chr05g0241101 [Helianthus annuus]
MLTTKKVKTTMSFRTLGSKRILWRLFRNRFLLGLKEWKPPLVHVILTVFSIHSHKICFIWPRLKILASIHVAV